MFRSRAIVIIFSIVPIDCDEEEKEEEDIKLLLLFILLLLRGAVFCTSGGAVFCTSGGAISCTSGGVISFASVSLTYIFCGRFLPCFRLVISPASSSSASAYFAVLSPMHIASHREDILQMMYFPCLSFRIVMDARCASTAYVSIARGDSPADIRLAGIW